MQYHQWAGFWKQQQLGTSCVLKNRYSLLETDDRAVDRANKDDAAPKPVVRENEEVQRATALKEYVRSSRSADFPSLKIKLKTIDMGVTLAVDVLLDSGATGFYIDSEFIR